MDNQARTEKGELRRAMPAVSRIDLDGTLVELVYRPDARTTAFAIQRDGKCSVEAEYTSVAGERLIPFSPDNNLIRNEVVLLPSEPQDYGNETQLISEVENFIERYVDLSPTFAKVATYYVFLTWLYDAFNELPYLRLRGDYGSGKTRGLLAIGSLCNMAFFASGASTVSPVFHTLDAFGGTLVFDEADFRFSDEKAEMVKILNNGNVHGLPVLRTMMNRQREFNPQAFRVFGPKIVATRGTYDDKGLESRFLTEDMGGRKLRDGIPINLPPSFKDEARDLRNKLLMYRFRQRPGTKLDASLFDPDLEPRSNQILLPLLSVISEPSLREELKAVARDAQANVAADRGLLAEAQALDVLASLMTETNRPVSVADITAVMIARFGPEHGRPITNRWIGGLLRKRLNLRTYKSHGVYVVPISERAKIDLLCARYGIERPEDKPAVQLGDVGTSGTE